jgi:FKBP-type peptidyl-prolyl cis-trans isomerase FklB
MRLFFVLVLLVSILSCQKSNLADEKIELKEKGDKISYGLGMQIGKMYQNLNIKIDPSLFARGFKDGISGAAPLLSEEELEKLMMEMHQQMSTEQEAEMSVAGEENKKKGEAFLATNKQKAGVTTTASGLQYSVIKPGKGKKPALTDTVTVHYKGTLVDGTEFDSSYGRGEPATFPLNRVIQGWQEGLQLMQEGAKFQFYIPSELAYGNRSAGNVIGPNSVLVFEVELISVK